MLPRRGRGLGEGSSTYLPPLLAGPALRVKHHHCRRERGRGRGGKDVRSARRPLPAPQVLSDPKFPPSRPWCRLLGSDLEKVSRSSRFLEKETDGQRVDHPGAHCRYPTQRWAPREAQGSNHTSLPRNYTLPGSRVISTLDNTGNLSLRAVSLRTGRVQTASKGPGKRVSPQNFTLLGRRSYWIPATHPFKPQAEPSFVVGAIQGNPLPASSSNSPESASTIFPGPDSSSPGVYPLLALSP